MTSIVEMVGKLLSSSSESKWKRKLCFCSYRLNQWTQWLHLFRCSTNLTQSWTLCQSVSWPDYISKYRSHLKMKDSRFIITSTVLPIYLESHHCTLEQMLYGVSWLNHALVRIPHSSLFPFLKQHHIVIGIWSDLILYLPIDQCHSRTRVSTLFLYPSTQNKRGNNNVLVHELSYYCVLSNEMVKCQGQ